MSDTLTWLLFALLASLIWGITNVMDAGLRRSLLKDDYTLTWATNLLRLPLGLAFLWAGGFQLPSGLTTTMMLIAGFLWAAPLFLYFKAMEKEDPNS